MKKLLLTLLILLLISTLFSCSTTPDVPICLELDVDRAYCSYTINQSKNFYWDENNLYENKTYWEARPSMLQVPPSSWAELKAFILKICKRQGNCSDVEKFVLKLEETKR